MAGVIIALCALGFTLFSFYWMNWRRGRLWVVKPRSFSVLRPIQRPNTPDPIAIALPLVLVNTGARPVVVQNLRLVIPELGGQEFPFILQALKSKLALKADRELAVQFPVRSREAVSIIGEFYRVPANATFEAKAYTAELQGLINDGAKWKKLCAFELRIPARNVAKVNQPNTFLALDNELGTLRMLEGAYETEGTRGQLG
jgi:hypothetical protein